ncbi:hypothetical protein DCW30_21480 [Streptomyces alfalfae]|nr:hypothetical protein D3X13_27405 [Streptomyces fradiae]RXX40982.1 hypothetical protein DCW30_21480 [Streptomyces alfalfae]RZN03165.1 hypothetical protein D4104_05000 [Streptomyces alfalfae]
MALMTRAEPAGPGLQLMTDEESDQAFTPHGTIMPLLFATPTSAGFADEIMPLQIGSPDVAFPRLNMPAVTRQDRGRAPEGPRTRHPGPGPGSGGPGPS